MTRRVRARGSDSSPDVHATEAAILEVGAPVPELELGGTTARTGTQVGMTVATNIATTLVGVFTGILAARLLGPGGEGRLAAIQTWPLLIGTIAMLGLPEALVYFISRHPSRGRSYTSTAMLLGLGSALLLGAVGWELIPLVLHAQDPSVIAAARVFLSIGIIYALVGIPHGSLRGAQEFASWNLFRVAPGIAWLVILVVATVSHLDRAIPLSRWYLVGIAAVGLPFLVVVARRLRGPLLPDPGAVRPLLRFGLPSVLTTVPQIVNLRLDQLLIIAFLPPRDLGLYVVAVSWSGGITPVLAAIGSVLFPKTSAEPDRARQVRGLALALQGSVLIGVCLVAVLAGLAPFGIPLLFGGRFHGSITPAIILVPAGGVLAWAGVAEEGLRGLGKPGTVLKAELLGAAVTIGALLPLLHVLGIVGAAVASLIGYSAVAIACGGAIARDTAHRFRTFLIPTRSESRDMISRALAIGSKGKHARGSVRT